MTFARNTTVIPAVENSCIRCTRELPEPEDFRYTGRGSPQKRSGRAHREADVQAYWATVMGIAADDQGQAGGRSR